jgi:hypothetical protein
MSQIQMALTLKSGFMILAYHILPTEYGSFGVIYAFRSSYILLTDIGLGIS